MESLSELFSPFDNLEILCEEHGIPCIGLCANYLCKDKTKFLCMKCIKLGQTCIKKENHELITISELLYRFFIKEENKEFDLLEMQTMNQIIKEYDKAELSNIILNYKILKEKNIEKLNQIQITFTHLMNHLFDTFLNRNNEKLNEIKNKSKKKIKKMKKIFIYY